MNDFNEIEKLWESAEEQISKKTTLHFDEIENAAKSKSKGISSKVIRLLENGAIIYFITSLLFVVNTFVYYSNDNIKILSVIGLIISVAFGWTLHKNRIKLGSIDKQNISLAQILTDKINAFRNRLPYLHQIIALGYLLFVVALNLLVDNQDGNYQINNSKLFILILLIGYVLMIAFMYLTNKSYLKQFVKTQGDLEDHKITDIKKLEKSRLRLATSFIILLLTLGIIGIFVLLILMN